MKRFIPRLNRIVKTLIFYDFVVYSGWGLVAPVFAIFILEKIDGGSIVIAGIAISIYWGCKALLQIPIGKYLDSINTRRMNLNFIMIGTSIMSCVPLVYIFVSQPWELYSLQIVHAMGVSMAVPAWGGVFMRHIDEGKESETWSAESSILGLGLAAAGLTGGLVIENFGFTPIFIAISIIGFCGVFLIHTIKTDKEPHLQEMEAAAVPIRKNNRYLR
ncbi:MAG: MFS transporter [Candidatus Spechtbacterales bacterium]